MTLVFVLGSHRTGTKLLAHYFNDYYENARSVHQYSLMRKINIMSNLRLYKFISEKKYVDFLEQNWFPILESNQDVQVYVESNGFNFLAVDYAKKHFKDIRVIHAVREPKSYSISHANWVRSKWKSYVANNLLPFWNLKAPLLGEMSWFKWFRLSVLEKKIWHWSFKNRFIEKHYKNATNNYTLFKLESVMNVEQRKQVVKELTEFCGLTFNSNSLSYFDKKQNQSVVKKITKETFDRTVSNDFFENHCRDLLDTYGY